LAKTFQLFNITNFNNFWSGFELQALACLVHVFEKFGALVIREANRYYSTDTLFLQGN
jgi:hypothetical protein